MSTISFAHTNIIADDWRALSQFYVSVFGCTVLNPERNLSGDWIDQMTGIKGSHIQGVHLALPGFENPPTLEIFGFDPGSDSIEDIPVNRKGIRHLAFHCEDIDSVIEKFIACGGSKLNEAVEQTYPGYGEFRGIYMKDPEGNIVEIQNWKKY